MMETEKTKEILENMLHPVRMRILTALAGSQGMTPLQLAEQLNDVPQATLYRHINRLAKSGLVEVVGERPVRGTLEKVYALGSQDRTHLGQEEMAGLSKADHLRFFTAFAVGLIDQFNRYLNQRETVDMSADGVGYTQVAVFMNDAELAQFSIAMNQALQPYAQPGEGRKKRIFATVMMPDLDEK